MTLPGSFVKTISVEPIFDASEATDQWFVSGIFEKGPAGPVRILTEEKLEKVFGKRVASSVAYDACRTFLLKGRALVISRQFGPTPVTAFLNLKNASNVDVIKVSANSIGSWGNDLRVTVTAGTGSTVIITVSDTTGALEQSPELASQAEIVAWLNASDYVVGQALAGSGQPAVLTETHLATGTDDAANITDTEKQASLDRFNDPRLGPGQVSMPGATTATVHAMLREHCDPDNGLDRIAILDTPDTGSKATLVGAVQVEHQAVGAKASGAYAPWGTTTDGFPIPPSCMVAARIAANDVETGNQNQAAAGDNGAIDFIGSLNYDFNDTDREDLNDNGVNLIWDVTGQGKYQIYGNRTLVEEDLDPLNLQLANVRLDMAIRWKARNIGKHYVFRQIDGQKHTAAEYGGRLKAMLHQYFVLDALFSDETGREETAYQVDTLTVNTPLTAAARKLLGKIKARRSSGAERVELTIYNYDVSEEL